MGVPMGVTAAIASIAVVGGAGAFMGAAMANKPEAPPAPPSTAQNAVNAEAEGQQAAERRRKLYAGVGRSSTILTGPSGLGRLGADTSAPKQLLGL